MKRYFLLLSLGFIPLIVGCLDDFITRYIPIGGFLAYLVELILLIMWGILAYRMTDERKNPVLQTLSLCAVGLIMFGLVSCQQLATGGFWHNFVGYGTQIYFLPVLTLSAGIYSVFTNYITIWPIFAIEMCLLLAVAFAGCYFKCRKPAASA